MHRFFIELAYIGTNYAGFQIQDNANTIQAEVETALKTYFKEELKLTGSSRTDAGVHARQNYFHFDSELLSADTNFEKAVYHLNAILPLDIVLKNIKEVNINSHCRFDAVSRTYEYTVFQHKNPFLNDIGYYYPYNLNKQKLTLLANEILYHHCFKTFSKKNTQVKDFNCTIYTSEWSFYTDRLLYTVTANRFLRGMVKGLVGTMIRCSSKNLLPDELTKIILSQDPSKADFSVASKGLTLVQVAF